MLTGKTESIEPQDNTNVTILKDLIETVKCNEASGKRTDKAEWFSAFLNQSVKVLNKN